MDRRKALQQLGALALLASPAGLALGHPTAAKGEGFQTLSKTVLPYYATDDKIEVLKFFHYGCSHCMEFEPLTKRWAERQPEDVVFVRVPVIWSSMLAGYARLYYTLQAMKRLDLHEKVFVDVQNKKMPLHMESEVRKWAKGNKLDVSAFMNIYSQKGTIGINPLIDRARKLIDDYKIQSVPTVAVAGRFVTSTATAATHENVLRVVDSLIERVRKG